MLHLLTHNLSIHDFVMTVEWCLKAKTNDVPKLLKRVMGTYAAHIEDVWLRGVDGPSFRKLLAISEFQAKFWDVKQEMLKLGMRKGILPVPQVQEDHLTSQFIESRLGQNHTVDNSHTKAGYMDNLYDF